MRTFLLPIAALAVSAPAAAQTSPAAARWTVERYYQAINAGDFRTAYRTWGDNGVRSGKSYGAFVRGFAQTASSRVIAGTPRGQEGAAGSTFITVPVDVWARLKNGRRQHFRGTYVMRRVNDVAGATPAQLRWHIDQARLREV